MYNYCHLLQSDEKLRTRIEYDWRKIAITLTIPQNGEWKRKLLTSPLFATTSRLVCAEDPSEMPCMSTRFDYRPRMPQEAGERSASTKQSTVRNSAWGWGRRVRRLP